MPGTKFQAIHSSVIPTGRFRGCLIVWDGNLTKVGTRKYQPWAIVNPYWPNPNPFVPGGGTTFRFHNALLDMDPTQTGVQQTAAGRGELFCAGHRWTADGRLFVAGGTRVYPLDTAASGTQPALPLINTGMMTWWEGAKVVYQWTPPPVGSTSFGTWTQMTDLEAERWYPTIVRDDTDDRHLILGGSDILPGSGVFDFVNTYESYRIAYNATPPVIQQIEAWGTPPVTNRQYDGIFVQVPGVPIPGTTNFFWPAFTEYPRAHAITVGAAPNQTTEFFVSGYVGQGIRWQHIPTSNPTYSLTMGTEDVPSVNVYSTNLILPAGVGAIPNRVLRIGGLLQDSTTILRAPTDRVESVLVPTAASGPTRWTSGGLNDIANMLVRRYFGNVVILPTGDLFAVGGINAFTAYNYVPELYSFATRLWTLQAAHTSPREYHTTMVLLPDGRVLVGGGENRTLDYEIWTPPYLVGTAGRRPENVTMFNSATGAPISDTAVPGVTYGQACRIEWTNKLPAGVDVTQVVMVAPASITHHDDGGQRLMRLPLLAPGPDGGDNDSYEILMPATRRHAPPVWYMVFAITNEGVPANAFWFNIK